MRSNDDADLIQFIARKTSLSPDLVNRVVEGGEPWPGSIAIQQYFKSRGKTLDETLADPDETLHGLDTVDVDPEVLNRHQRYVAASLDVREEEVSSIREAMQEFFRMQIKELRRAKRRLARRGR